MEREPLYRAGNDIDEAPPRKGPLLLLIAAVIFALTIAVTFAFRQPILRASAEDREPRMTAPKRGQAGAGGVVGSLRAAADGATVSASRDPRPDDQPRRRRSGPNDQARREDDHGGDDESVAFDHDPDPGTGGSGGT